MKITAIIPVILLFICSIAHAADPYWVDDNGEETTWANCQSASPISGSSACTLATANTNASAGDTINLQPGTYTTAISPTNSGSSGSMIHYTSYDSENQAIIRPATLWGIFLQGNSYIKVSNVEVTEVKRLFFMGNGATHNEITGSTFTTESDPDYYSSGLITQLNTAGEGCTASTHNWIHANTFGQHGEVVGCVDRGTIRVAADPTAECGEDESYYNTLEDNVFYYGGHDNVDIGGRYNVIRNNIFHNEEAVYVDGGGCTNAPTSGYFGNRNLIISGYTNTDTNLIEGNRLGYAGTPPDDDGANGIENAGNDMIIRYNYVYGNGASGIYLKNQAAQRPDNNRIYNNTVYYNGYGDAYISSGFRRGIFMNLWDYVNVSHNGTTYQCIQAHYTAVDKEPGVSPGWTDYWQVGQLAGARVLSWTTYLGQYYDTELRPKDNIIKNNIVYDNYDEDNIYTTGGLNTYTNNLNTDPQFENADLSDKTSTTLPDLSIQATSGGW